jgi:hypothetical protein
MLELREAEEYRPPVAVWWCVATRGVITRLVVGKLVKIQHGTRHGNRGRSRA